VEAVYAACQDPDIQYYDYLLGAFRADDGALVGSFCLTKRAPSGQPHDWWVGGLLSSGPA
jgi:hypothetical protein